MITRNIRIFAKFDVTKPSDMSKNISFVLISGSTIDMMSMHTYTIQQDELSNYFVLYIDLTIPSIMSQLESLKTHFGLVRSHDPIMLQGTI